MKKLRIILFALIILPVAMLFTGCSLFDKNVYITNIVKTDTLGTTDTYTIYYSDGTSSTMTIENGEDAQNVEIESIFDALVERGVYEDTTEDFQQFIKDYYSVDTKYDSTQASINKALQSAVNIYSAYPVRYYSQTLYSISCGAGVIYQMNEQESYIITNYHVVYSSDCITSNNIANDIYLFQYGIIEDITITEYSNSYYSSYNFGDGAVKCEYIGGSMNYDIAILKVNTNDLKANNPQACAVTVADNYSVGETAIAIGNPEGDGVSVTQGVISVESEILTMKAADEQTTVNFRVMRIDTAVNGGNSGGGLFNAQGELIGIVNAKALTSSSGTVLDNMAYALPHDNVTKVADNIIHYFNHEDNTTNSPVKVRFLKLGISYTSRNGKAVYDPTLGTTTITDELYVETVSVGIANSLGIKAGDVIFAIKINDTLHTLQRSYELKDLLLTVHAGDDVLLYIRTTDTVSGDTVETSKLIEDVDAGFLVEIA